MRRSVSSLNNRLKLRCFQIAELYQRGWNKYELAGLTGANLLRVLKGAERVAMELQARGVSPVYQLYKKRTDIPAPRHGEL